jgi:hypothetical protein
MKLAESYNPFTTKESTSFSLSTIPFLLQAVAKSIGTIMYINFFISGTKVRIIIESTNILTLLFLSFTLIEIKK